MLEGIEILSQKVAETSPPMPIFACFITTIITVLVIWGTVLCIKCKEWGPMVLVGVTAIFMTICSIIFWVDHFTTKPQCYTEYKVICSDTVDFNEFNQKYEILEQEGKIYTIREKEVSD